MAWAGIHPMAMACAPRHSRPKAAVDVKCRAKMDDMLLLVVVVVDVVLLER